MHRSGTSALAGAAQMLGAELGSSLLPTARDNEKGFFEHLEIRDLHRRLLGDLGRTWHDLRALSPEELATNAIRDFRRNAREVLERDFGSAPLWGIKDPRLCRLLP
ncbi:MAG: sulfotransferase family protein, partial [Acidobacteria bacterium]|nr:sulfotransferase family protein [Acidobacteriota bacterium]